MCLLNEHLCHFLWYFLIIWRFYMCSSVLRCCWCRFLFVCWYNDDLKKVDLCWIQKSKHRTNIKKPSSSTWIYGTTSLLCAIVFVGCIIMPRKTKIYLMELSFVHSVFCQNKDLCLTYFYVQCNIVFPLNFHPLDI